MLTSSLFHSISFSVILGPIMSRSSHEWGGVCPSTALPIAYAVLTAVAFKPSLHGEKPVNKDLSYRKVIFLSSPYGQCRLTLLMNFDVYVRETESERIHTL